MHCVVQVLYLCGIAHLDCMVQSAQLREETEMAVSLARQAALAAAAAQARTEALRQRIMWWISIIGATPVLLVAGWISYFHIVETALGVGYSQSGAHIIPLAIDGIMVMSAIAIVATRQSKFSVAKLAFATGLAFSLAANLMQADPSVAGYAFAGCPSILLIFTSELLLRQLVPPVRKRRRSRRRATQPAQKSVAARTMSTVTGLAGQLLGVGATS